MYASYQGSINNLTVTATTGLLWLATVVLFGIRRPAAVIWAGLASAMTPVIFASGIHYSDIDLGAFTIPLPSWLSLSWNGVTSTELPAILFGLGAVQLARNPDGFVSITSMQNYRRRMKRRAKQAAELGIPASKVAAITQEEELVGAAQVEEHARELVVEGAVHSSGGDGHEIPEEAVLVVSDLRAGYGAVEVLHGIDLVVRPGEITALLGANGSGKTTLCSTIAGLVPVSSGALELYGVDVSRQKPHQRSRRGMLVAPESRGIFPGLSVEENLSLVLTSAEERQKVYDRFPVLRERRKLPAGSLSGGEQQMLTLAPVLVNPPRVVVADEPTLGLAPLIVQQVMRVFEELRDRGTAILLVEEKARNVLPIAAHVAFLELGHVVWSGPRDDIDDERLVGAYFGTVRE
jgi:ABC-type branched-subunit amino acid transport system ATPase component